MPSQVLFRTFTDWECFIVNDGSPDDTSAVAHQLISANPNRRIVLIEKENEGLAQARNTAIARAQGEWIAPLDSDDILLPTYFERSMRLADARPQVNHITPDLELFGAESGRASYRLFARERHVFENQVPYCSLYKRTLWERTGGYTPVIPFGAEDWNFTVSCSAWLVPERLSDPLVRYRRHPGGSMVSGVEAHQAEVNACLHSLHPDIYDPTVLMIDHDRISAMAPETRSAVETTISRFPQFATPYLWRGLYRQRSKQPRHALRDFEMAARLGRPDDWQPWFCLTVARAETGDAPGAAETARETLKRCPKHPLQSLLTELIVKVAVPSETETMSH